MVIEPLGWETGTDSIKSTHAGNKVHASAKSITPGFNQVQGGKTRGVGELLMSRLELVRGRRANDGRIKAAPNSDSEARRGWIFVLSDNQIACLLSRSKVASKFVPRLIDWRDLHLKFVSVSLFSLPLSSSSSLFLVLPSHSGTGLS